MNPSTFHIDMMSNIKGEDGDKIEDYGIAVLNLGVVRAIVQLNFVYFD